MKSDEAGELYRGRFRIRKSKSSFDPQELKSVYAVKKFRLRGHTIHQEWYGEGYTYEEAKQKLKAKLDDWIDKHIYRS